MDCPDCGDKMTRPQITGAPALSEHYCRECGVRVTVERNVDRHERGGISIPSRGAAGVEVDDGNE